MCIIAYVPAGTQISEEMIKINFKNNPDGAGVMWKDKKTGLIHIKKGYKTPADLMVDYFKIPLEVEKAIHFRIATSGKISSATCHPFPVRKTVEEMRKPEDTTEIALMHNGIISFCTPKGGMSATFSDTMVFASKFLYPFRKMLRTKALQELIEHADSSRFLIFSKENDAILLGKWEERDGVMYSNGTFKCEKRNYYCGTTKYYGSYYGLDYDGDYYENKWWQGIGSAKDNKNTNKTYKTGKDLVMLFKMDTSKMDNNAILKEAERIIASLVQRECIPSMTYKTTPEGIKIKVEFLPLTWAKKGGLICGYKWTYGFEDDFKKTR